MTLIERYHDRRLADRVFELAWTHCQVILRQINASEAGAQCYARLYWRLKGQAGDPVISSSSAASPTIWAPHPTQAPLR